MMKSGFIAGVLLTFSAAAAQTGVDTLKFSGNAFVDLCGLAELRNAPPITRSGIAQGESAVAIPRRSPIIAGLLSLVVPGTGEFYSESYLKSAIFFAADVALWALAYAYDHKADVQTDKFQNFANAHYSVVQYAQYAQDNFVTPLKLGTFNWKVPGSAAYPWTQINWSELNRMEQAIAAQPTGSYYSHLMPEYNSQQYYELIGKYPQFSRGWDDAPTNVPSDWNYINSHPSTESLGYMSDRGQANNYYTNASTLAAVAIINHVLSAADAVWSATTFNHVHAEMGVNIVPGEFGMTQVAAMKLRYTIF